MNNFKNLKHMQSILVTTTRTYTESNSVAANMAMILAHHGKRVALVDADLKRPSVHHLFNLPNHPGLMEILHGESSYSRLLHSVNSNHLFVLTAGINNNGKSDPFAHSQTDSLLSQLKEEFDKVIIHGPPYYHPETVTLASKMDGVVLIIYPNRSRSYSSQVIIEKLLTYDRRFHQTN